MAQGAACSCGCGAAGPKPLPLAEVSRALEQSERTLRRWVDAGCPHHKGAGLRGALTFDQDEVVAWMREMGRTGDVGRPPAEVTLLAGGPQSAGARPAAVAPSADAKKPSRDELLHLTAQANLRIKQLEGEKRARVEREAGGALHEVEACRARSIARISAVKARFQVLPGKLAQELAGKPYDVIYAALGRELDEVLSYFAGPVRS